MMLEVFGATPTIRTVVVVVVIVVVVVVAAPIAVAQEEMGREEVTNAAISKKSDTWCSATMIPR